MFIKTENMLKNNFISCLSRVLTKREGFFYFFLTILILLSCLFIIPETENKQFEHNSSQLQTIRFVDDNLERIVFIDEDGNRVVAADKGYATCIIRSKDNQKIYSYFDDSGLQVSRYPGYYAILREYDDKGNNTCISYLDSEEKPCITAYGYAIEKIEYNDRGQIASIRYYDVEGNPVKTVSFGSGINNEYYNDGNICISTFVDDLNTPIMTRLGYATVKRIFYLSDELKNNMVESEFYFDEKGNPIALPLGQFGIHKEYYENGLESVVTYLDSDGKPIVNNKGYTTVKKTYNLDNSIATEQYYNAAGSPVALSDGQYGILKKNNQTVYLDQNGEVAFNLKRLLYNQTWLVILGAIIIIVLSAVIEKKWNFLLLFVYLLIIVYMTLLFRDNNSSSKTDLLQHYRIFFLHSEARIEILQNIWLFIPLGSILYQLLSIKRIMLIPIAFSIIIETIQYITNTGFCSLDDIISNGIGGIIGFIIGGFLQQQIMKIKVKRNISENKVSVK